MESAWNDVMAHMPEGWIMRGLWFIPPQSVRARRRGAHWRAQAVRRGDLGLRAAGMVGIGSSPEAALHRLADYLSGVGHQQEALG